MKTSTTWSSSRMATRVSCAPEEMIISLFIAETPTATAGQKAADEHGHIQIKSAYPCESVSVRGNHVRGLICETPHPHVEDETETRQRCDQGRAAVAHERQRDALHRRKADRHRDVVDRLEREPRNDASHQIRAEAVLGETGRLERSKDDEEIQAERAEHADEPLLLRQNREDEVVVRDRQELV